MEQVLVVEGRYEATMPDDDALVRGAALCGVRLVDVRAAVLSIHDPDLTVWFSGDRTRWWWRRRAAPPNLPCWACCVSRRSVPA
jgi:hypothetical protein